MLEALRPVYEAALKSLRWSLETLKAKVDATVHDIIEWHEAAIAKLEAELGIVKSAGDERQFSAGARAEADKLVASLAE
jgi:hypothetical protein